MQRRIIFDANDLLKLFTHYSEGKVPLDAELKEFLTHPILNRFVGMWVRSAQWEDTTLSNKPEDAARGVLTPFHVRYEGRKVMNLTDTQVGPSWSDSPDAPKRQ